MIKVKAPGKMILLGEYAVLEDTPALVCAVDVQAKVYLEKRSGNEFLFSAPSLHLQNLPFIILENGHVRFDPHLADQKLRKLSLFRKIMEYLYQHLPAEAKKTGLRIEINTDAFYSKQFHSKMGFGSSAALCVALVKGIIAIHGWQVSDQQIFRLALEAHHHAQGKVGSGIDIAASYFGGFLEYQRIYPDDPLEKLPRQLAPCQDLFFAPVFTGRGASTTKLVGGVNQLKRSQPDLFQKIMAQLQEATYKGLLAFKANNVEQFLSQVRAFYLAMKELGQESGMPIISEVHQKLALQAEQMGVVYKPSGAGSGDIGVVFSDASPKLNEALLEIKKSGYLPLSVQVAQKGVTLEKTF